MPFMQYPIDSDTLLKVEELFVAKNWKIEQKTQENGSIFNRFCSRLKQLDKIQQHFIIQLSERFIKIELSDYLEKFYDSLFCLDDSFFLSKQCIFVFPLNHPYINNESKGKGNEIDKKIPKQKTKSSDFLHYMIEADDYSWVSDKLIITNSIEVLKKRFNNKDSALILIDDYIGSGKTAIKACQDFLDEEFNGEKIQLGNLKIVTIAAQKQGIDAIYDLLGVSVVSNIILKKGISDFYQLEEAEKHLELMKNIELAIGVKNEEYRFGFEKTEGLITFLKKTPNNTFPVYWFETAKKAAPFPRNKLYFNNGK
jgi:hypothetical protein